MGHRQTVAAAFLALGFATVSAIFILVEPGMGFAGFADYFDPAKVIDAAPSVAWMLGDLIYLGFGVALFVLAISAAEPARRSSALIAAALFFFIGCLGRILAVLPSMIADKADLEAAVLGLLPVRFAALRVTVFALGVYAWRTTVEPGAGLLWRGLGLLVLVAAVVFLFRFIPVPLLFMVWALVFAVRRGGATAASAS